MRAFLLLLYTCCVMAQTPTPGRIVSTGYSVPTIPVVTYGQVTTLFVQGLKVADAVADTNPLPTKLSGLSVKVTSQIPNYPKSLPISSIVTYDSCAGRIEVECPLTHVTVQIPFEATCTVTGPFPNECSIGPPPVVTLTLEQNGVEGPSFPVIVSTSEPHFLNSCDTVFYSHTGPGCDHFVTHADGQQVTSGNPARPGETIIVYAVGLGRTQLLAKTGEATVSAASVPDVPNLVLSFLMDLRAASPAPPVVWMPVGRWIKADYAGLVKGYVGLYQVNVRLPERLPDGSAPCPGTGSEGGYARLAIGAGGFGPTSGSDYVDFCVRP